MRIASIAAGLLLAVCVSVPGFVSSSLAASDQAAKASPAPGQLKKKASRPLNPTWEQCFDMSVNRGFNHDTEEWQQSIQDCMAGKIPL